MTRRACQAFRLSGWFTVIVFLGVAVAAPRAPERAEGARQSDLPCQLAGVGLLDEGLVFTGVSPAKRIPAGDKGRSAETVFFAVLPPRWDLVPRVAYGPGRVRAPQAVAGRATLVGVVELRI